MSSGGQYPSLLQLSRLHRLDTILKYSDRTHVVILYIVRKWSQVWTGHYPKTRYRPDQARLPARALDCTVQSQLCHHVLRSDGAT